jgi:hypothetical protein
MNETKPKNETNVKTEPKKTTVIGTTELSEIVSESVGRLIEPKRIRSVLRNDPIFNGFDDSVYTKYRFDYPSGTVDRIVKRFIEIESERTERSKRSVERKRLKTERKTVSVLTLKSDGSVSSEKRKPDGSTEPDEPKRTDGSK